MSFSDCTRAVTLVLGLGLTGCTSVLGTFDTDGAGGGAGSTADGVGASTGAVSPNGGNGVGSTGPNAGSTGSGNPVFKRAFVTSKLFQGNFGQFDIFSICNQAATQAGLGGGWSPWVSSGDNFPCTGGPWQLVDGSSKVGSCDDLFNNTLVHAIDVNEFGKPVPTGEGFAVWTGVAAKGGIAHPSNCNAWQSNNTAFEGMVGDLNAVGPSWTEKLPFRCDKEARLYCFEQ